MRIQHNILSMNAYRNYTNNTSALGKNLEKLSSGYKINRAGDDAAGLAISEKMRAQIKGLEAAQKNVKDATSLIKTAEGAMQEIQDMLSRMKYLATQSANGTYEDDVDRENLQMEVDQLLEEIDRIADSANFNGIHLLDGTFGNSSSTSTDTLTDADITAPTALNASFSDGVASTSEATADFDFAGIAFAKDGDVTVSVGGKDYNVAVTKDMTAAEFADAFVTAFNADKLTDTGAGDFTAAVDNTTDTKVVLTSANKAAVTDSALSTALQAGPTIAAAEAAPAGQADGADGTAATLTAAISLTGTATNGESFTITSTGGDTDLNMTVTSDGTNWTVTGAPQGYTATFDGTDFTLTADEVGAKGVDFGTVAVTNTGTNIGLTAVALNGTPTFTDGTDAGGDNNQTTTTGGRPFQIGDSSGEQLFVTISDMHTDKGMNVAGLKGVGVSTIDAANAAIDTVKTAINFVSSVRGQLGAYQNRLDHTANNLSVMHENIQDAESTIRDTDVADEMMAYTKNNILIQSAQAMLAQANAVPQGVLQLLQ